MLPTPPLAIQNSLAYGATGPSCPAQRTPQRLPLLNRILRVSIGTMHLHERLYVRPESNPTHDLNLDIALGQSNLSPFFPSAGLLLAV